MHEDATSQSPPHADPGGPPLGVLVGFDGSDQSVRALYYAARAARRLGSRLSVVTAFTVPSLAYADASLTPTIPAEVARLASAQEQLEEAREHLRGYPGQVDLRTVQGDAAGVLVEMSARAQLVVVGARGRGGFFGRLLGSVSSALPAHAHCPTLIVPRQYEVGTETGAARFTPRDERTPVVVGVDGSEHSRLAVRHAVVAARTRGAPLHLLMVISAFEDWGGSSMSWMPDPELLERHRRELAEQLETEAETLRTEHPGLRVTSEAVLSEPVTALLERTATSQLTVLGTRGHGRVASVLLGSISQAVLQHAEGPVMVVPPQGAEDPDPAADSAR